MSWKVYCPTAQASIQVTWSASHRGTMFPAKGGGCLPLPPFLSIQHSLTNAAQLLTQCLLSCPPPLPDPGSLHCPPAAVTASKASLLLVFSAYRCDPASCHQTGLPQITDLVLSAAFSYSRLSRCTMLSLGARRWITLFPLPGEFSPSQLYLAYWYAAT